MSQPIPTGDNAKVYSGIRDVPIYVGEASRGNRLPFGPYRRAELVAIAAIGLPAITWLRHNVDSGYALPVLLGSGALMVTVVVAMRLLMPRRRPSIGTRALFLLNTIRPPHRVSTDYCCRGGGARPTRR
ncbi:hypothetical protein PJI20_10165 [Mycobacterium kansasii]